MNVLLTGASSGIGYATAKKLLEAGHTVVGVSRSSCSLTAFDNFHEMLCDLSDFQALEEKITHYSSQHKVDTVILNAGTAETLSYFHEENIAKTMQVLMVNSFSCKVILDSILKSQHPNLVIAMSSGITENYVEGWGSYFLSKSTLELMLKIYTEENKATKFLTVHPHIVNTKMRKDLVETTDAEIFTSIEFLSGDHVVSASNEADLLVNLIQQHESHTSGSLVCFQ